MIDKKALRKEMISRRDALSSAQRSELSGRIAERLFAMKEYKNAGTVLSYASFRSEVITDEINKRIISDGKNLFLPQTIYNEKKMVFRRVSDPEKDLVSGSMGIMEPSDDKEELRLSAGADDILMLMPCVAFDEDGNRLGYGGGFYDRFLSENPDISEHTVLLAFEAQRAENIPAEPDDIRPKLFLTEEGLL